MIMDISATAKRRLLFVGGCIPTRLLIAYVVSRADEKWRQISAVAFTIIGIAMLYLAITGKRLNGPETFGEGVWWTPELRVLHACIYFAFAGLTFAGYGESFYLLYADAFIGLFAFLVHESRIF